MKKQLGLFTSLLFLCASALCWVGCSNYNSSCCYDGYYDGYSDGYFVDGYNDSCCPQPVCPQPCTPVCQPCAPVCNPICQPCQAPCAAPCEAPCAPSCARPCESPCAAPCAAPCAPSCEPCAPAPCEPCAAPCEPCGRPSRTASNSSKLNCGNIIITATQPQLCILGDTYVLDLDVQACRDVCEVSVTALLPEGVSLVRSQPEGVRNEGGKLTWLYDGMRAGEHQRSRVWLRADREGDLCVCFCAEAVPVQFCTILCAKPILICEKCGPCEVCPGDPVPYVITVTNKGSCAAEDVVVVDNVPDGLEHSSGLKTLTFRLGTIEPCETKKLNVTFTAVKRGRVCNTIVVNSCNANQTSCQFCTNICKQCIELTKVGDKEVMIGQNARYLITVTNPGDKPLTDVIVTDTAPMTTSIVEARGASVTGNQAVWKLRELKPGERQSFELVLTSCTPGFYCNKVCVTDCQGCNACAEACTRWKGRPALNSCVTVTEDPICVGEITSYCISVVNQGSEEDSNVRVVVKFPEQLVPLSVTGETPGQVSGQVVSFAPYAHMGPRQELKYRVDARGVRPGDARVVVEVSSDTFKAPIVQQQSTVVN